MKTDPAQAPSGLVCQSVAWTVATRAVAIASLRLVALALLSIASFPLSAAELKPINVRDFGAKGDGTTDDTAAINAAIAAAKKQGPGTIVSLPSGRY
ncbi:MAG: Pectate lyase superfamily protein, partial [Verrucomicrobiota bacterium]